MLSSVCLTKTTYGPCFVSKKKQQQGLTRDASCTRRTLSRCLMKSCSHEGASQQAAKGGMTPKRRGLELPDKLEAVFNPYILMRES